MHAPLARPTSAPPAPAYYIYCVRAGVLTSLQSVNVLRIMLPLDPQRFMLAQVTCKNLPLLYRC